MGCVLSCCGCCRPSTEEDKKFMLPDDPPGEPDFANTPSDQKIRTDFVTDKTVSILPSSEALLSKAFDSSTEKNLKERIITLGEDEDFTKEQREPNSIKSIYPNLDFDKYRIKETESIISVDLSSIIVPANISDEYKEGNDNIATEEDEADDKNESNSEFFKTLTLFDPYPENDYQTEREYEDEDKDATTDTPPIQGYPEFDEDAIAEYDYSKSVTNANTRTKEEQKEENEESTTGTTPVQGYPEFDAIAESDSSKPVTNVDPLDIEINVSTNNSDEGNNTEYEEETEKSTTVTIIEGFPEFDDDVGNDNTPKEEEYDGDNEEPLPKTKFYSYHHKGRDTEDADEPGLDNVDHVGCEDDIKEESLKMTTPDKVSNNTLPEDASNSDDQPNPELPGLQIERDTGRIQDEILLSPGKLQLFVPTMFPYNLEVGKYDITDDKKDKDNQAEDDDEDSKLSEASGQIGTVDIEENSILSVNDDGLHPSTENTPAPSPVSQGTPGSKRKLRVKNSKIFQALKRKVTPRKKSDDFKIIF